MKKIYHLSTCDTCQRIMQETGTEGFTVQDIKHAQIPEADLERLAKEHGSYEALFNKRAVKYRTEGLKERNLSESDFKRAILKEYTFLKRPVYLIGERSFVGNSKKTVEAIKAELSE